MPPGSIQLTIWSLSFTMALTVLHLLCWQLPISREEKQHLFSVCEYSWIWSSLNCACADFLCHISIHFHRKRQKTWSARAGFSVLSCFYFLVLHFQLFYFLLKQPKRNQTELQKQWLFSNRLSKHSPHLQCLLMYNKWLRTRHLKADQIHNGYLIIIWVVRVCFRGRFEHVSASLRHVCKHKEGVPLEDYLTWGSCRWHVVYSLFSQQLE